MKSQLSTPRTLVGQITAARSRVRGHLFQIHQSSSLSIGVRARRAAITNHGSAPSTTTMVLVELTPSSCHHRRLLVLGAGVLFVVTVILLFTTPTAPQVYDLNVAFIGNSVTFVNDLPRLMQRLSGEKIVQNSCLHGSLNLASMLSRGSGMWTKYNGDDYGACTVPQLLFGYDENLSPGNENGFYVNDGKNPCFMEEEYYYKLEEFYQANPTPDWDVIVLNDRTIYPGLYAKRERTLGVLESTYLTYFQQTRARPIFLMTWGYPVDPYAAWYTQLGNISEFTSHVYHGYQQYTEVLAPYLPESQQPLVAKVGLAFLVVYEENFDMWERLFYVDELHPSPHGTYLIACTLFATIYGRMPDAKTALPEQMSNLWQFARMMEVSADGPTMEFPTRTEAAYLYETARRVVLGGHLPRTLLTADQVEELEATYRENGNDDRYDDDDAAN